MAIKFIKRILIAALMIFFNFVNNSEAIPLDKSIMSDIISKTQTAQKTNQIIFVVDHNLSFWNKNSNGWTMDFESYCGYGKNGFSINRHSGDQTTPIGSFPMLYAFGLVDNPGTEMTYKKITPRSYLSGEESTYNQWIESDVAPYDSEHLIDYYQYKYAMNIGFNINPTIYGRGAAIFLHCKSDDRWWTAGCVSVSEDVMLKLLQKSRDGLYIIIVPNLEYLTEISL